MGPQWLSPHLLSSPNININGRRCHRVTYYDSIIPYPFNTGMCPHSGLLSTEYCDILSITQTCHNKTGNIDMKM